MGISRLPDRLQCRSRCLAGATELGFMHIKGFNILLCESDPESEGLVALVVPRPGKSFILPLVPLLVSWVSCCSSSVSAPLLEGIR